MLAHVVSFKGSGVDWLVWHETDQKEVICKQHSWCFVMAKCQSLRGKHFLILEPESANIWWLQTILSEEVPLPPMDLLRGTLPKAIFHNLGDLLQQLEFVPASREREE